VQQLTTADDEWIHRQAGGQQYRQRSSSRPADLSEADPYTSKSKTRLNEKSTQRDANTARWL